MADAAASSPRLMEPAAAAEVLVRTIKNPTEPITVADASVASGLPIRDAEAGLTWLTSEYRGHLRVTEDGDLVHRFPTGFTKPWETKEAIERFLSATGRTLLGAGRFIVRAWLLIAMVSYALLFVALIIGMTLARQSNDRDSPGIGLLGGLFRMIADAFFWTFHPFSPVYVGDWGDRRAEMRARHMNEPEEEKVPFYERVNRFVFGPPTPKEDPHAARARVLREIRAQRGRIALADVMRVTGLPHSEADPLMARLMLDHEGEVDVSEGGGIYYTFEALRRTATSEPNERPRAAWERPPELRPLTGNSTPSNVGVALLNAFNLFASAWVVREGLTISNMMLLFERHRPPHAPIIFPNDGVPIVFGIIPLVFSTVLFVLPMVRALFRMREKKRVAEEHARLAVLREVVTHASKKEPIPDEKLRAVVRQATNEEPTSKDITRRVVELGGDVDTGPNGEVRYRFAELEADAEALEEERARASDEEAKLGRVVFASDR